MYVYRHELALWRFCSTDKTRPTLGKILLDGDKAIATDGHRMMIVTTLAEAARDVCVGVNINHAKLALKSRDDVYNTNCTGDILGVGSGIITPFQTHHNSEFPPWKDFVDELSHPKPTESVTLNPAYLADLYAYLRDIKEKDVSVDVTLRGVLGPLTLTTETPEAQIRYILMPMLSDA